MIRLHLIRFSFAVLAAGLGTSVPTWSAADEARDQLFAAMDRYHQPWDEGFIEAQVESSSGPADVTLWWRGDQWRLDYVTYRTVGPTLEPTWNIFVVSEDRFCRYSPLDDSIALGSRSAMPDLRQRKLLRVHPTESWFELSPQRKLKDWIDHPGQNQQSFVYVRPEGGFAAFIGPARGLESFRRAAAVGPIADPMLTDNDSVPGPIYFLSFNQHGLLNRAVTIGRAPLGTGIEIECQWTDDPFPRPRRLLRRFQSAGSEQYRTDLEIDVIDVSNRLPPRAPSFQVPPNDLPLRSISSPSIEN